MFWGPGNESAMTQAAKAVTAVTLVEARIRRTPISIANRKHLPPGKSLILPSQASNVNTALKSYESIHDASS